MRTVKEVSEITGVSIRTLRYYDEIGLLRPAGFTEGGYRLYDGRAIERLQEILFFRELEIPLADIQSILDNPDYDRGRSCGPRRLCWSSTGSPRKKMSRSIGSLWKRRRAGMRNLRKQQQEEKDEASSNISGRYDFTEEQTCSHLGNRGEGGDDLRSDSGKGSRGRC